MATTAKKNQKQLAALPVWRRAAILFTKTLRWTFRTFVAVLTSLIALLFIASAFSDWFSPNYWLLSAYLGLFFPIFAAVILVWATILAIARRWKQLIVIAVVLLLGSERLWRYCPINLFDKNVIETEEQADGNILPIEVETLKVMTYNTHAMGEVRLPDATTHIDVIDVVRNSGADIVCLQEYAFAKAKNGHNEEEVRSLYKDIYPYYGFITNKGQTAMGVAILSKYPITKNEAIDNKTYHGATTYSEIDYKGRKIAFVNCYMQSFQIPPAERTFMNEMGKNFETDSIARLEKGLRQLSSAFRDRAKQSLQVVDYLAAKKELNKTPLFVLGDMNDTPISFTYNKMCGNLSDTWEEAGLGPGITFRMFPYWFRIDHIFHSSHIRALNIEVLNDVKYSDHYPVLATYQLLP